MLAPDTRAMYLSALQAPAGFAFEEALATTFSLDLEQLLGFPVALALGTFDPKTLGNESSVALLEAIRRTAGRLVVFADATHIHVPGKKHLLYGLLEPVVVPVLAPGGGAFHPKVWVLRFRSETDATERVRVLVLSRNLSPDRSWDVALSLEGPVTGRNKPDNRPLVELLDLLPTWALRDLDGSVRSRIVGLRDVLHRTEFELPDGFEQLRFHVLGARRGRWLPPPSKRLVVVSPFVTASALDALAATTDCFEALISRGEELDAVAPSHLKAVKRTLTLHESAETEDGEEPSETGLRGLHAKVYLAEAGWYTHTFVGSANATTPALLEGANVEVLAELVGKTSRIPGKGIEGFLHPKEGMGPLLVPYQAPATPPDIDEADRDAERALDLAACELAKAGLRLSFTRSSEGVLPTLSAKEPVALAGVASIAAWLVTVDPVWRADAAGLLRGASVTLAGCAAASATTLVSFELRATTVARTRTLVLALEADGLPEDRDAHVFRLVIDNRKHFLAYLYALLSGVDANLAGPPGAHTSDRPWISSTGDVLGHGLLEQLVRARARSPERLAEIQRVVDALTATPEGCALLPEGFMEVWSLFEVKR